MKKKVLYISYDGMTDALGQSQVLPYLVGLSDEYDFHLLSCEKKARYSNEKENIQNICDKNRIQWHPLKYHKSPPVFSTLFDYYLLLKHAKELQRKYDFSLVHCRSYLPTMVGQYLKKQFGIPFLFDMRGFWADERKDAGLWKMQNPIYRKIYKFFKKKEKQFVLESDYIISLTHAGKEEITSWPIDNISPIQVIPCCADFKLFDHNHFKSANLTQEREKLKIDKGAFVLTYLGSIGTWYMIDEMLDFFIVLKKKRPSAIFQFITMEPPNLILDKAKQRGLNPSSFVISPAKRTEVPVRLGLSDLSIFFIRNYYSKKASSPTKQAEIMGMGLPLVCNVGIGDVDKIVKESNSGLLIHDFSKDEFNNSLKELNRLLDLDKQKIRQEGIKRFSLIDGINKYKEVYKIVI